MSSPSGPAPWGTSGDRAGRVPPTRRAAGDPETADAPVIPPMLGPRPAPAAPVPEVDTEVDTEVEVEDEAAERHPADPVAVAAIVVGCLGVFFLGIVSAIVAFILAAEAGRRAREAKRPADNAYFAVALAFVDGVFWIFLHYRFQLPIWVG